MAEREQRFPAVAVEGAVTDEQALAVVQDAVGGRGGRQAFFRRRPGHGQPPPRLDGAEQHVGERIA